MGSPELVSRWRAVIQEWQLSGEPLASFSRSRGLKEHQVWFWKNKLLGSPKKKRGKFIPVGEVADEDLVEIKISGVSIKLPLTLPADKFVSIIRCLAQ